MAIRESREVVIDASPAAILDALSDVEALPSWSPVYDSVTLLDAYADGRPHHVSVTVKALGIRHHRLLEYRWGPDWVVWDAIETAPQWAQHAEYTLTREGEGTRVRFDLTLEPTLPIPDSLAHRGADKVMTAATEGLRRYICR